MENILSKNHPTKKFLPCSLILSKSDHLHLPGLNLCSPDQLPQQIAHEAVTFYEENTLKFSLPIPGILEEYFPKQGACGIDPCTRLVTNKREWARKRDIMYQVVENLKEHYGLRTLEKMVEDATVENGSQPRMLLGIARLANHLAHDPDEKFEGNYNWYFGNTLTRTTFGDNAYLIHSAGRNLDTIYMSLISSPMNREDEHNLKIIQPQNIFSLPSSDCIYDVVASSSPGFFCARQRDYCSVYKFNMDEDQQIKLVHCSVIQKKKSPFISMDVRDVEICTVMMNRRIYFWDSEREHCCINKARLPKNTAPKIDNFIQMKFSYDEDPYIYSVIDRHQIFLFDRRINYLGPCNSWTPAKQIELCESLSLLIPSVDNRKWYIGTNHSCLLLDSRMGFIRRWTHMLTQPPCLGKAFRIKKRGSFLKEGILLGTQSSGEFVSLCDSTADGEVNKMYFPALVPNLSTTLQAARIVGLLSESQFQKRFDHSFIGLNTFRRKTGTEIYYLNSKGDIFYQNVVDDNSPVTSANLLNLNAKQMDHLENWGSRYLYDKNDESEDTQLIRSHSCDLSNLLYSDEDVIEIPKIITNPEHYSGKWKFSRHKLKACKDILAPCMLNDYGVEEIDQWYGSDEEKSNIPLDEACGRVESWLFDSDMVPEYPYESQMPDSNEMNGIEVKLFSEINPDYFIRGGD